MTPDRRCVAAVEVSATLERRWFRRLVRAAYCASRRGEVVLVLRGASRESVDRVLDPVVSEIGIDVSGVIYIEEADAHRAADVVGRASLIVASSAELVSELERRGMRHLPVREGATALEEWGRGDETINAA